MADDRKRKSPKQRMEENKNPTFDFKTNYGKNSMIFKTDTTGLASGKKKFDYSRTLVNPKDEKIGHTYYGPVSARRVNKEITKRTRPDTPLAETPEPKKID